MSEISIMKPKSKYWHCHISLGTRGKSFSLSFLASRGHWHSLACGPFHYLQKITLESLCPSSDSDLLPPSCRDPCGWSHWALFEIQDDLFFSITSTKFFYNTFHRVLEIRMLISLGSHSSVYHKTFMGFNMKF